MSAPASPSKPSFREALRFWSKLGWISFGGTAAHIALMHDYLVEERRWISNSRFLHALSHCMLLPGPEAQQLATYIGWKLHGRKGGLAAGVLFVLPSMFVLLGLSLIYVTWGTLPWIAAMFHGLRPAVIALVALALLRIGRRALRSPLQWAMAAAAFLGMFVWNASLLLIMLGAVVLGLGLHWARPSLVRVAHASEADAEEEHSYYINRHAAPDAPAPTAGSLLRLAGVFLLLWLVPFMLLLLLGHDAAFWRSLSLFFTKTAFVTLGGSYTVIPYVAQIAVTKLHWLTPAQMTDGFALAETTPGPLIIVLAFVGFMASYNHFHGSLWMGAIGLFITVFYTFLPCFLFVFAGAPLVERTHGKPAIEAVLGLVMAVVVGAMLELMLFLGKGVLFPHGTVSLHGLDVVALVAAVVSLVLLTRYRLNVIYLVGLSIVFGAVLHWIGLVS